MALNSADDFKSFVFLTSHTTFWDRLVHGEQLIFTPVIDTSICKSSLEVIYQLCSWDW